MPVQEDTERSSPARAAMVSPPAFTGRERELAAMTGALAGRPALVLIEGEAGIGKSRLIQEFLSSAPGQRHRAVAAICPPFRQPHTLGPVADAIRQAVVDVDGLRLSALAGALRPLFPEWADALPSAPEPAEDASAARHRVFAALAELLAGLEVGLLVAEDAHWADEATLEFLLYLASRQPLPLSLVITWRPEDTPATSLVRRLARLATGTVGLRLTLGLLDIEQTAGLMSSMLAGEPISEEFAAFTHQHTEGMPLAVEELVRLMADRADLARRGGAWLRRRVERIAVPSSIRDAVLERVARLSPDARTVLRAAALLTNPADEATVQLVTDLSAERLRIGLSQALDSGLLVEDSHGLISFRHMLAAQAVHEAINGPDRRVLHQRAGRALEAMDPRPLARLARHFREAGVSGKWCEYAEQAADRALGAGDEATAAVLLHELVTSGQVESRTLVRLVGKIPLLALTGDTRLRSLGDALDAAAGSGSLNPAEEALVRFQLGRLLVSIEDFGAGRGELERAVPHLARGSVEAARAMMLLALPRGNICPAPVHLRWLQRATTSATSLGPSERLRLAVDRVCVLLILGEQSGWAEAAGQIPDGPLAPGQRMQIIRGHTNVGEAALNWGRYGEARRRLTLALELADRNEYQRFHAGILVFQSYLDWVTGEWPGLAERVASLVDELVLPPLVWLRARLVSGLLQAAAGNRTSARELLRQSLNVVSGLGASECAVEVSAALARLHIADGAAADALQVTDEPAEVVARKATWIWAADLAPARAGALIAANRADEAAALASDFARGLRGRDAPAPKAGLALCRAMLAGARGEHARAAALFGRAAAAEEALPRPYAALLARERQAGCLLAAGQQDGGLSLLQEVLRGLSELGAAGDAARVARALREHGVQARRPVPGRPGYGNRLSPREAEVAQHAAAGLTNRQIAEVLCLSPKTVARHLRSAMGKQNVSSRTALAVRAMQAGIIPAGPRGVPAGPARL